MYITRSDKCKYWQPEGSNKFINSYDAAIISPFSIIIYLSTMFAALIFTLSIVIASSGKSVDPGIQPRSFSSFLDWLPPLFYIQPILHPPPPPPPPPPPLVLVSDYGFEDYFIFYG